MTVPMWKRMTAEAVGTFWLVFAGCGSAVLAAKFFTPEGDTPINLGIGLLGVSAAFGLTVLTMAYAIGHVSGCHLNPAVTVGLAAAGRFAQTDVLGYILAQVGGAIGAAGVLYVIASGQDGFALGGFAANGFGEHSPGKYSMVAALVAESVLTAVFLLVILGTTDRRAPAGTAPIAIGLCLTLIHLVSIPVTNTSVNPARSTSQAIFVGGWAVQQLWLFWVAPVGGAVVAGLVHRFVFASPEPVRPSIPASAARSQELVAAGR
jgi:aquaporin Z